MTRRSSFFLYHIRYNFSEVIDIPGAHFQHQLLPILFDSSFELSHILGFVFVPEICLHTTPNFLNGIEVGTFRWAPPPID